jgi:hypothetical protein
MEFANYCRIKKCTLYAMIYPHLDRQAGELNSIYVPKIRGVLTEAGARIINVDKLSLELPYAERVVSRGDGHPSPKLHRLVAEEMYRRIDLRHSAD